MNIGTWIKEALTGSTIMSLFNQIIYQDGIHKAVRTLGETVLINSDGTEKTTLGGESYDSETGADNIQEISPLNTKRTTYETLVTEQDLTDSFVNAGAVIDMRERTILGTRIYYDCNDSQDVDVKVVECDSDGGNETDIEIMDVWRLWTGVGEDDKKKNHFDIGTADYVRIKIMAGTVGATAGDLTILINKDWRM